MGIKVLVVDDTDHVRQMLVSLLSLDGFHVVGEASSGAQALLKAQQASPDVIVMDYAMPEMDGIEATRQIRRAIPKQSIILYTAYPDADLEKAAQQAGAAMCVGKVEGIETLERSISELCLRLTGT